MLNRDVVDVPSIVTDNTRGMHRALEHLRDLGHDTVTYLAGPEASWADGMRWRAIREAGAALGVRVRRIGPGRPTVAGGVAAVAELRRAPTTAVVAYNDLLAIGLMRGLARVGVVVPGDLSVVGFDNTEICGYLPTPLTSVSLPKEELGQHAVQLVLAAIERGEDPETRPEEVSLPTELVVRASTGPASATSAIGAAVSGSTTSNVLPSAAATRSPPTINSSVIPHLGSLG